jgi:hypothetical protein
MQMTAATKISTPAAASFSLTVAEAFNSALFY